MMDVIQAFLLGVSVGLQLRNNNFATLTTLLPSLRRETQRRSQSYNRHDSVQADGDIGCPSQETSSDQTNSKYVSG